jgi:uncharacterized protein (TIGR03083 family)
MPDHDAMRLAELESISGFLHTLSTDDWDHDSLCEGWRVRDVISHMCVGYTTPMLTMVGKVARFRFNIPKASFEESKAFGSEHLPAEILAVFDDVWQHNVRKGISKTIKSSEGLVDHLIHHQDIRRPLNRPRDMPEDRLRAALDIATGLGGFVKAKQRATGLRFVATDIDWRWGDGPEVTGTGEAILLAMSGRPAAFADLRGEGVPTLTGRAVAA